MITIEVSEHDLRVRAEWPDLIWRGQRLHEIDRAAVEQMGVDLWNVIATNMRLALWDGDLPPTRELTRHRYWYYQEGARPFLRGTLTPSLPALALGKVLSGA